MGACFLACGAHEDAVFCESWHVFSEYLVGCVSVCGVWLVLCDEGG